MRALSIRQPFAEEILRGLKPIEYRSVRAGEKVSGKRFYIYASPQPPTAEQLRRYAKLPYPGKPKPYPTGVLVGTAVITKCSDRKGAWQWHLSHVRRLQHPRTPTGKPQPVWFWPFGKPLA